MSPAHSGMRTTVPRGFTLGELLIVIVLVAAMLGLILPAIAKVQEAASRTQCTKNLKDNAIAVHNAADQWIYLPPAIGWYPFPEGPRDRNGFGPTFFHLVPYFESTDLIRSTATEEQGTIHYLSWKGNAPSAGWKWYICPASPCVDARGLTERGWGAACYAYNALVFAKVDDNFQLVDWQGTAKFPESFPDGTARTILFAEKYPKCSDGGNLWAWPEKDRLQAGFAIWTIGPDSVFQVRPNFASPDCDPARPSSPHRGGINVVMADGSTHFVSSEIRPDLWWIHCTPNGGEPMP